MIGSINNAIGYLQGLEERFNSIDTNGDGSIDKSEFQAMAEKMPKKTGVNIEDIFSKSDTNQDGAIDKSEYETGMLKMRAQRMEDRFNKIDTNGDGNIDKTEFQSLGEKLSQKAGLSSEEIFSEIDTNQDGLIDKSEDEAAQSKMHAQMGGGMSGTKATLNANSEKTLLDYLNNENNSDNNDNINLIFNASLQIYSNNLTSLANNAPSLINLQT